MLAAVLLLIRIKAHEDEVANYVGEGTGERILNPTTNVYMEENSYCEMEMVQLRGVSSTVRDTNAELGEGAKLVLTERLLTHDNQAAESNINIRLLGKDSNVQVISRSVAQDNSVQDFNPLVTWRSCMSRARSVRCYFDGKCKSESHPRH